jgi:hypothetical protein
VPAQELQQQSVVICSVVRNCERTLEQVVQIAQEAFCHFGTIKWCLVESDSEDKTSEKLAELSRAVPDFYYVSLGSLDQRFPKRTERIAYCRNIYRRRVAWSPRFIGTSYAVVLDADHVNFGLTSEAVASSFVRDDWDACFANQFERYYDLYALRHQDWIANDVIHSARFFSGVTQYDEGTAIRRFFGNRMIKIEPDSNWIRVESAFGGLGIYKRGLFRLSRYRGQVSGRSVCEHVPFHDGLGRWRKRLFINPALLNGDAPEHWM